MKRAALFAALLAGISSLGYLSQRIATKDAYDRGYKDGLLDGSNSGFLEGQRSVDCPGTSKPVLH